VGFKPSAANQSTSILVRVGVSLISTQQACSNAQSEIPDFNFEKVRANARAQWNDLLGRIQDDTTGVPKETVQLFYSSVSKAVQFIRIPN
jgi:putative alpha-1,2-mannosidase